MTKVTKEPKVGKYKSIVISGQIASGTTTAAQNLAKKLKISYLSAGDFFRKYTIDHKIPLYKGVPDEIDIKMDKELTELAQKGAIIDSHYAGYFNKDNPEVLKVLLVCDWEERIKRAIARSHTHSETAEEIKKREKSLDAKFRKLYADENFLDPKFFDLVIDTIHAEAEEVQERIISKWSSST